jgi:hypothetical protein
MEGGVLPNTKGSDHEKMAGGQIGGVAGCCLVSLVSGKDDYALS